MNCSVAIVIPALNEEKFIDSCLESVINQSYPVDKMDIMVIDGGSSDRTKEIVLSWSQKCKNIRLLENPGRIQSIAFNIGVEKSIAPYVVRLDAHAYYDSHYIELCVRHLVNNPEYGNVGGKWDIRAGSDTLIAYANALLNQSSFGIGGADFRVGSKAGEVDTVPFGAFPRRVLNKVGLMNRDLSRGEDNEFNMRIKAAGYKIYFDPDIQCIYYARSTFRSALGQMYANGFSIGKLLFLSKKSVAYRHLVPFVFVGSLLLFSILSSSILFIRVLFLLELSIYFLLSFLISLNLAVKNNWKLIGVLPWLFFSVHVSYGIGTICGIIKARR